jgi:uncharacterized membrane protein
MRTAKNIFAWVFGILLITAGINHFIRPQFYAGFIPDWLPLLTVNYATGIIEAALGFGMIIPRSRRSAGIGTLLLMLFFLPLHLLDALRENPVIGSRLLAWIRLGLQFVLIYWAWFVVPPAKARCISAKRSPLPPP